MGNLGSFWIVAPILVLAVGFLAVLLSTGLANRQLPPMVGVLPTIVSLAMTFALYLETSDAPLTLTLFAWESGSDQSIALAYYVDAWAALLAVLALFLGLCAQMLLANQALDGRSRQNWAHIFILATLALLLNLFFSASLAMLYMAWVATGLVVYASIAIGSGQDRSDEGERVPSGEMRPPPEPAGSPRNPSEQRGETLRMAACIAAGYALLGSILLLTRTDGDLLGVVGLRSASFGLGASILMAFALGAYLGLYPFKPWRSCAGARPSAATMTIPLSFFPALGAFYVLGRMYPVSTGGTSSSLSTITAAMALATIVVASARAWGARELDALLVDVVSVELAFAVLAFVLAPAYGISGDGSGSIGMNAFAAGLFIFLNCVLSAQTILLGIVHLRVRQNGDTGEVSGSASPRLRTGVGSALFAAPWVSLIGLPLTMGFAAKGMLFSIGFDPARVALLLIGVVANGIIIVAALRLLDKEVAAVISRRATASHRSTGSVPAEAVGYNPDPTPAPTPALPRRGIGQLKRIGGAVGVMLVGPVLWVASPWAVSLALGLVPNQALRWVAEPAAVAVLDDGLLASPMILGQNVLFFAVVAVMLAATIFAFYLYPIPLTGSAIAGPAREHAGAFVSESSSLKYKALETAADILAVVVIHLSAVDGALSRMSWALNRIGAALGNWNHAVHESYFFPSLTVLGIIILFVFLD